ncbi:hypothetical protein [Pantoea sp. Cy-639]|uniref:hypothetical protein n=1 Tax=Pantoea sp. Cy-639 TaxID=2608360 RepID=UPI00141E6FEB|nr:hypothetical protein [Pantoea sp. Cy-639]
MCELLQVLRISIVAICVAPGIAAVLYANSFFKKNGIDMNTFLDLPLSPNVFVSVE